MTAPDLAELRERGFALHESGDLEAAARAYREVLSRSPGDLEVVEAFAALASQSAQWSAALDLWTLLVGRRPDHAAAHAGRAEALAQLGRLAEALQDYEEALRLEPRLARVRIHHAALCVRLGRGQEALSSIEAALGTGDESAEAWMIRGLAQATLREYAAALASLERALALGQAGAASPRDLAPLHANRGGVLLRLARPQEALASCEQALALLPDHVGALCNRGAALNALGRHVEALASLERALAIGPGRAEIHTNRADALSNLGRYAEALAGTDAALALDPRYGAAHQNRALVLAAQGRTAEALTSAERALEIEPDNVEARCNRAQVLLLAGDFERGWPEYEWRLRSERLVGDRRPDLVQPLWRGETSLAGKTILLYAEQGLGDTIQFCRYATLVAGLGARVILEVPASLARLMHTVAGVAQVIATGEPLPPVDLRCPLLSLPLAFRTTLATVPARVPYLGAADTDRRHWSRRLENVRRPRIGLAWSGGFRAGQPRSWSVNARRNIPLAKLALLGDIDAEFFSLQQGEPGQSELAQLVRDGWEGPALRDHTAELRDFADTAALIEQLDLVISVDTSVVHLAGSLGKPVWLLNRYDTCWRWMLERCDSPWYPTLKLYRQGGPFDWDAPLRRLHADLEDWVRSANCRQATDCQERDRA